jgi:hypothetical protein
MSEHPDYDVALGCCCEQCMHLGCDDCPFHKGVCWTYEEGEPSNGNVVFFPVPERPVVASAIIGKLTRRLRRSNTLTSARCETRSPSSTTW